MPKADAATIRSSEESESTIKSGFIDASDWLKVIAHPVRLHIIRHLMTTPLTVREIAVRLGTNQDIASKHLRLLHRSGILFRNPKGRLAFYSVRDLRARVMCHFIMNEFVNGPGTTESSLRPE